MARFCSLRSRQTLSALATAPFTSHPMLRPCGPAIRHYSFGPIETERPSTDRALPVENFKGESGRVYSVEKVLQKRDFPLPPSHVYLATSGNEKFVLKNVPDTRFTHHQDRYRLLRSCPYLRTSCDSIQDQSVFVYKFFSDDLLDLAQENPDLLVIKRILKDTLRGLAALHDQDIVHLDVKPNNIVVHRNDTSGMDIAQVQLADLEDSLHIPPGMDVEGLQSGNWMWRSPEAHTSGRQNKPSDMFSFGIVCIYAVHKITVFAVKEDELKDGEELLSRVLARQMSYFAEVDGLVGLCYYLGDNPWLKPMSTTWNSFIAGNPRTPFELWEFVDADLKDLVGGLTNFDPLKRLTAQEALDHPWFKDV